MLIFSKEVSLFPLSEPLSCKRILVITHLSLVLNLVKPKVGLRNGYRVPNEYSPALHHIIHHHCITRSIRIYQAKCAARLRWVKRERRGKKKKDVDRKEPETVVLKY
jgi:hypothetical protein